MSVEEFLAALAALAGSGGLNSGWRRRAACLGMPAELFFPERGDSAALAAARAVCANCPVRETCAEFGLSQKFGVWGGLSELERRRLRRQRAAIWSASAVTDVA